MATSLPDDQAGPSSESPPRDPIQISIIDGDAFIWSTESIARVRREHGIVGLLTGSLPLIPQQNVFLGVPLQLFEEEVVYLMRCGVAILVDDRAAHEAWHSTLSLDEVAEWHRARQQAIERNKRQAHHQAQQNRQKWQQRVAGTGEAQQRRREREQRREQMRKERLEAQASTEAQGQDQDSQSASALFGGDDDTSTSTPQEQQNDDDEAWKTLSHPITIATDSLDLPWHTVHIGTNAFAALSAAYQAGLWRYPETRQQRARCAVFEDLRGRGYYLAKGLRFGGDFNVYPGDPLRYHSHFTATVQTSLEQKISAQEIVAAGRLGTAVKKAHLLCTAVDLDRDTNTDKDLLPLNTDNDRAEQGPWAQVEYFSLTWAGFGT